MYYGNEFAKKKNIYNNKQLQILKYAMFSCGVFQDKAFYNLLIVGCRIIT